METNKKLLIGGIVFTLLILILAIIGIPAFKGHWDPMDSGPIAYYVIISIVFAISLIFTVLHACIYFIYSNDNQTETNPLL